MFSSGRRSINWSPSACVNAHNVCPSSQQNRLRGRISIKLLESIEIARLGQLEMSWNRSKTLFWANLFRGSYLDVSLYYCHEKCENQKISGRGILPRRGLVEPICLDVHCWRCFALGLTDFLSCNLSNHKHEMFEVIDPLYRFCLLFWDVVTACAQWVKNPRQV